jgi:hypothetical protein
MPSDTFGIRREMVPFPKNPWFHNYRRERTSIGMYTCPTPRCPLCNLHQACHSLLRFLCSHSVKCRCTACRKQRRYFARFHTYFTNYRTYFISPTVRRTTRRRRFIPLRCIAKQLAVRRQCGPTYPGPYPYKPLRSLQVEVHICVPARSTSSWPRRTSSLER